MFTVVNDFCNYDFTDPDHSPKTKTKTKMKTKTNEKGL